jgi:hypothetical protein
MESCRKRLGRRVGLWAQLNGGKVPLIGKYEYVITREGQIFQRFPNFRMSEKYCGLLQMRRLTVYRIYVDQRFPEDGWLIEYCFDGRRLQQNDPPPKGRLPLALRKRRRPGKRARKSG